jgi:mRNA interferase YafQ
MRTIERTGQFKRDYKRLLKGTFGATLDGIFTEVLILLVADNQLPAKYNDHSLGGEWKDHRDCHVKPDVVLIYRKPNPDILQLVRIGSHSDLGF